METILIVAITSILTAFFSNLLAPRLNAWFERKYQDRKILKKTLRTLMEIENYVQRNLKHPTTALLSEAILAEIKKLENVSPNEIAALSANLPLAMQNLLPAAAQILPDKSEFLDKEFTVILTELSTVDPLLAYQISERHIISPIQQMNTFSIDLITSLNIEITEADTQNFNKFAQPFKSDVIDEMLADLRTDILTVAQKIGRIMLWKMMSHYTKRGIKQKKDVEKMTEKLFEQITKATKTDSEPAPRQDTAK